MSRPVLIALALLCAPHASAAEPQPRVLVPAYFYPAGDGLKTWNTLLDSAEKAPVVAIVNPDSGPGKAADPNYVALLRRAKTSKATLIGYVTLGYGKRPLSAVKADVDSWLRFYPGVRGIFFDEQPSGPEHVQFAAEAFAAARAGIKDAVVVSNPGTVCARDYLGGRDGPAVCLYEGKDGYEKFSPPAWVKEFPPERFVHLVYKVKGADAMRATLKTAAAKRAGFVYVTDADGANPWDRLPGYWAEELAALKPK